MCLKVDKTAQTEVRLKCQPPWLLVLAARRVFFDYSDIRGPLVVGLLRVRAGDASRFLQKMLLVSGRRFLHNGGRVLTAQFEPETHEHQSTRRS